MRGKREESERGEKGREEKGRDKGRTKGRTKGRKKVEQIESKRKRKE